MKKILLTGLAAFAAFFGKTAEEEMEFSQDDAKKVNDELHSREASINALTTERDALKVENETFNGMQAKAEGDLAAANAKIATLEAENTTLKAGAGAESAAAISAAEAAAADATAKVNLMANSDDFMTNVNNIRKEFLGKK